MDSAGFLCILCVFVESNPPKRTNTTFFLPHFPVFVVFQKRFLYILFFTYRLSGDQCPPEIPQRLGSHFRGSWRAAPERGAREPLRHLLALLANAASPERGGKGRCPHRPWVGAQNRGWRCQPRFGKFALLDDIRNETRPILAAGLPGVGMAVGGLLECPDRTTRWDRRCPSTSSCPRADRTQTADRGRAHG